MRCPSLIRTVACLCLIGLAGCTVLPRSGPTKGDVYQSSYYAIPMIYITPSVLPIANVHEAATWPYTPKSPMLRYETLGVDDQIEISIWENAAERLYTGNQQGPSNLGPLTISGEGNIYIPYLGKVKAAGMTIDQLQRRLTARLKNKVINPQVGIKKLAGLSKKISIQGVVTKPGTFEIMPGQHDVISMLAEAGGSTAPPELTEVALERQGKQFRATLADIYHSPRKNIDLKPRDNLILSEINRSFTSLGATGRQQLVKFPKKTLSLIEAIGLVEGLNDEMANPSRVFLLRYEHNPIVHRLIPKALLKGQGRTPVIYEINMREMQSVFSAQHFNVRDGDLILTINAPYTNVRKVLSSLSPVIALGRTAY